MRTVLRRLEDKGYVTHAVSGRTFVFRAVVSRGDVAARAVKHIVDWFCNGSLDEVLVGMADARMLDSRTLQALAKRIANAKEQGKGRQVMLETLVSAALRTLLLALLVELGLRILRVRHPQLLLAAWTAVLMASLAMPVLQRYALITVPSPVAVDLPVSFADLPGGESPAIAAVNMAAVSGATPADAVPVLVEPAWRLWLMAGYLMVAGAMLVRLTVGVVLSWKLLRAARPIRRRLDGRRQGSHQRGDRRAGDGRRQHRVA